MATNPFLFKPQKPLKLEAKPFGYQPPKYTFGLKQPSWATSESPQISEFKFDTTNIPKTSFIGGTTQNTNGGTQNTPAGYGQTSGLQINPGDLGNQLEPQYRPGSGTYNVTDPINGASVAKTALGVGSAAATAGLISKIGKTQQGRQMRMLTPVQTSVLPEQDLPSEVLAQKQGQISRIRSTYTGSDPAMKLISDLLASGQRGSMRDEVASQRGLNLMEERKRVAAENSANEIRAGETRNTNIDRMQNLDDYKLESDINKYTQYNKLLNQVGSQAIDTIENNQAYNLRRDQIGQENSVANIDTWINHLNNQREAMLAKGNYGTSEIDAAIEAKIKEREGVLNRQTPGVWTRPYRKNGGKLLPRQ